MAKKNKSIQIARRLSKKAITENAPIKRKEFDMGLYTSGATPFRLDWPAAQEHTLINGSTAHGMSAISGMSDADAEAIIAATNKRIIFKDKDND